MKIRISEDDAPLYYISQHDIGTLVDVSEEQLERWRQVVKKFVEVQDEMDAALNAALEKTYAKKERRPNHGT